MAAAAAAATTRKRRRAVGALWPCDDAAWTVCQFLLPCDLALLRAVDRSTRDWVDVQDLVWDRIRSRLTLLAEIHGGTRFPLPTPSWMSLSSAALSWALSGCKESDVIMEPSAYVFFNIWVVPSDTQRAVQWAQSNFTPLATTDYVFVRNFKDEGVDSPSVLYPWEDGCYARGHRIIRMNNRDNVTFSVPSQCVWMMTGYAGD